MEYISLLVLLLGSAIQAIITGRKKLFSRIPLIIAFGTAFFVGIGFFVVLVSDNTSAFILSELILLVTITFFFMIIIISMVVARDNLLVMNNLTTLTFLLIIFSYVSNLYAGIYAIFIGLCALVPLLFCFLHVSLSKTMRYILYIATVLITVTITVTAIPEIIYIFTSNEVTIGFVDLFVLGFLYYAIIGQLFSILMSIPFPQQYMSKELMMLIARDYQEAICRKFAEYTYDPLRVIFFASFLVPIIAVNSVVGLIDLTTIGLYCIFLLYILNECYNFLF